MFFKGFSDGCLYVLAKPLWLKNFDTWNSGNMESCHTDRGVVFVDEIASMRYTTVAKPKESIGNGLSTPIFLKPQRYFSLV